MKPEQEKVLELLKRERDKLSRLVARLTVEARSLPAGNSSLRHRARLESAERLEKEFSLAIDVVRSHYVRYYARQGGR